MKSARHLFLLLMLTAGAGLPDSALAQQAPLVPTVSPGTPEWLLERSGKWWPPTLPEHGALVTFGRGDSGNQAARHASDMGKIQRHRAKISERREAFKQRKGAPVPLRLVSIEHLHSGRVLLAWEGPQDAYYEWGYFDPSPEIKERREANAVVSDGVGEGSMLSPATDRAYLISANLEAEDGMMESERLTGSVVIESANGAIIRGHVKVWDSEGNPTSQSSVSLLINGEIESVRLKKTDDGIWAFEFPCHSLLPGEHVAFAKLDNLVGTTPEGDERGRWGGIFRTPDTPFTISGTSPQHAVGFRRIESVAVPWDHVGMPGLIHYVAELPAGMYDRWKLEILHHEEGRVREWEGAVDRTDGLSLSVPWDGKRTNGEAALFGDMVARLTLISPDGSVTLERSD